MFSLIEKLLKLSGIMIHIVFVRFLHAMKRSEKFVEAYALENCWFS